MEDQRGTEINFELPDFLKDKENAKGGNNRLRKLRRNGDVPEHPLCYEEENSDQIEREHITSSNAETRTLKSEPQPNYENRNISSTDDFVNVYNVNSNQNFNVKNVRIFSSNKILLSDESLNSHQLSPLKNSSLEKTVIENFSKNVNSIPPDNPKCGEPPPLPPKPKILPMKPSNWAQHGLFKVPKIPRNENSKQGLFLEQPTSSFV